MARTFDGVNQYLMTTSPPITVHPMTLTAWFNTTDITSYANNIAALCKLTDITTGAIHFLRTRGDVAGDPVSSQHDGSCTAYSSTGITSGQWHHVLGAWYGNTNTYVYLDGGSLGTGYHGNPQAAADRFTIGAISWNNTVSNFFTGSIAEVAIYNTNIGAEAAATLGQGYSPLLVRPQDLVFYAPLVRHDNDIVGGITMTAYNSPTYSAHPPVLYATTPYQVFLGTGGGAPAAVTRSYATIVG